MDKTAQVNAEKRLNATFPLETKPAGMEATYAQIIRASTELFQDDTPLTKEDIDDFVNSGTKKITPGTPASRIVTSYVRALNDSGGSNN